MQVRGWAGWGMTSVCPACLHVPVSTIMSHDRLHVLYFTQHLPVRRAGPRDSHQSTSQGLALVPCPGKNAHYRACTARGSRGTRVPGQSLQTQTQTQMHKPRVGRPHHVGSDATYPRLRYVD